MRNEGERKVHLLGFAQTEHVNFWRPYSVDSSSWSAGMRWKIASAYLGAGRMVAVPKTKLSRAKIEQIAPRVSRYGLDAHALTLPDAWDGGDRTLANQISMCAWIDYSLDLARTLEVRLSLPMTSPRHLRDLFAGFDRVKEFYMGSTIAPKLRVLVAFPYFKGAMGQLLAERADDVLLLIDSGAFTAWQAGETIALDDYCRFIETLPIKPWRYFQLDVVGNPDETVKNYDEMRRRGFDPIPIFTRGADPAILDYFYSQTDLVGVGGLPFVTLVEMRLGKRNEHAHIVRGA